MFILIFKLKKTFFVKVVFSKNIIPPIPEVANVIFYLYLSER